MYTLSLTWFDVTSVPLFQCAKNKGLLHGQRKAFIVNRQDVFNSSAFVYLHQLHYPYYKVTPK